MCGTVSRSLKGKTQLSTQIKYYKVMAIPVLMYGSENCLKTDQTRGKLKLLK